jgi:tetratricopeptide (TPR) repeat protein
LRAAWRLLPLASVPHTPRERVFIPRSPLGNTKNDIDRESNQAVFIMTTSNQRICLNMIVKDEAHVIRRCLEKVRPFIESWVIVDTGSTDHTQDIIRQELAGIPGELHDRPWKDFGTNRTEALELARKTDAQYAFVIDADEEFIPRDDFAWPSLTADSYLTLQACGDNRFYRTQLMRLAMPWRYVGVLHEVAMCEGAQRPERLDSVVTYGRFDSARNKNPIEKYKNDARVLEMALEREPGNARYMFYLAQSYRDSQQDLQAERCYRMRALMGGWEEEVWQSLYQIGLLLERMDRPAAQILEAQLEAFNNRPTRAEPLVALARYFRSKQNYGSAWTFAKAALDIPRPNDILFLDGCAYQWRPLDEYAVASYWIGNYKDCLRACEALLAPGSGLPDAERERVKNNEGFALQNLRRS